MRARLRFVILSDTRSFFLMGHRPIDQQFCEVDVVSKSLRFFSFLAPAVMIATTPVSAQNPVAELADTYLETYVAEDIEGLRLYMSSDVVFEDPTMNVAGRDEVISRLTQRFSSVDIQEFAVTDRMVSGAKHVLVTGVVKFTIDGAGLGAEGKTFSFDLPMVVSLKIENLAIVRHVDYFPADEFIAQLNSQR